MLTPVPAKWYTNAINQVANSYFVIAHEKIIQQCHYGSVGDRLSMLINFYAGTCNADANTALKLAMETLSIHKLD